jgi:UDP-N-acetylglucosamine acyltransferase
MAYVHIAHDCHVKDEVTFSNNASLAGHVTVHSYANLGGFVGVHQFTEIGAYAFCAGGSIITKDVPPYVMVAGYPAEAHGLNLVGLKRRGFSESDISVLKQAYKILYRQGLTTEEALEQMATLTASTSILEPFIRFVAKSERGIVR